jgi:hypothetical protein
MVLPSIFIYILKNIFNHNKGNGCDIGQLFVEDSYLDCQNNCVSMAINCANCAKCGGGECVYIQNGLFKQCSIKKAIHFVITNCYYPFMCSSLSVLRSPR